MCEVTDVADETDVKATYRWLADGTKAGVRGHNASGNPGGGFEYLGSLVYEYDNNGDLQLESAVFGGGRILASNGSSGATYTPNYFLTDHLGSTRVVIDGSSDPQRSDYHTFGVRWSSAGGQATTNRYLYTGKELQTFGDLNDYDLGARFYNPRIPIMRQPDPLAGERPRESIYLYCGGNPINRIDPDGMSWRPTYSGKDDDRIHTGYSWVPESESYDSKGVLKQGLFSQAIFFSHNGTFDASSNKNIGSSTAYVYKADGTIVTFDASTYPSDQAKYATVPEGEYRAIVGAHTGTKSSYPALRMSDDGTYYGTIELGGPNPSAPDRTYAIGINIHKPGTDNITGKPGGSVISAGCFLIDIKNWNNFIGIFNNSTQKGNTVGIINSRTLPQPFRYESISSYQNRTR